MTVKQFAPFAVLAVGLGLLLTSCTGGSSSPVGTWGPDEGPQLVLAEDGTLSGTDGCNRLMGGWKEADGVVDFGEVASTMMACEGVDTWLNQLSTATVQGETLQILDTSGTKIGTLDRS